MPDQTVIAFVLLSIVAYAPYRGAAWMTQRFYEWRKAKRHEAFLKSLELFPTDLVDMLKDARDNARAIVRNQAAFQKARARYEARELAKWRMTVKLPPIR